MAWSIVFSLGSSRWDLDVRADGFVSFVALNVLDAGGYWFNWERRIKAMLSCSMGVNGANEGRRV